MLTEPVRSASKELFPPKAGEGFDGVREIKARTRAFLAKLVASSAVLVTLVAAGNAVVTRQYGMLSVIWSIAGPFLAGIMVYHFASSAREEVEREAILWRRSEISAQPGDSASAQALARVEVDFRHALTRGRRLDRIMAAVPQGEAGRKLHKAHACQPRASVRVHDKSRGAVYQQRFRAARAAQRDPRVTPVDMPSAR